MVKKDWYNITVKEAEAIFRAIKMENDVDRLVHLVSACSGMSLEALYDMSLSEISDIAPKYIGFLSETPKAQMINEKYEINGRTYVVPISIENISISQFIDLSSMVQKKSDMSMTMTAILVPDGHKYNDGYDMDTVLADMGDFKFCHANDISFFFTLVLEAYTKASLCSSTRQMKRQMKKKGNSKETKQILREAIQRTEAVLGKLG